MISHCPPSCHLGVRSQRFIHPKVYEYSCANYRAAYRTLYIRANIMTTDKVVEEEESSDMDFLIRLVQVHETFRKAELEALSGVTGVGVEFVEYNDNVRFILILFDRMEKEDTSYILGFPFFPIDIAPFPNIFFSL